MSQSLRALWLEQWIDEWINLCARYVLGIRTNYIVEQLIDEWINGAIFVQDKICAGDEEQLFHFVMCSMFTRTSQCIYVCFN